MKTTTELINGKVIGVADRFVYHSERHVCHRGIELKVSSGTSLQNFTNWEMLDKLRGSGAFFLTWKKP
jgi:hypothetical protein